jgi:lysophospholipase L1-like esterase
MKNRHRRLNKITTTCLSLVLFVLTIEIAARVDDKVKYGAPFLGRYSFHLLKATDSDGIKVNVPNSSFEKWKINQFGFRGPQIALQKPEGTIRIACMGLSETFGMYESPDKEWPRQLASILNQYEDFEVVNTSVPGLLLNEYSRYIEKYVLAIHPDVIILYLNPFPYAVGANKFSKRQSASTEKPTTTVRRSKSITNLVNFDLRVIPKIKQAIKRILPQQTLKRYRLWQMERQITSIQARRLNGAKPLDVAPPDSLNSFRHDIEELFRFLNAHKIDVILSSYPVLISNRNLDEYPEIFLDHRRFYVELSLEGIIDVAKQFNEILKTTASRYSIPFIDNSSVIPKNTRHFADNVHYTDEGANLVAKNFAKYIISIFPSKI